MICVENSRMSKKSKSFGSKISIAVYFGYETAFETEYTYWRV